MEWWIPAALVVSLVMMYFRAPGVIWVAAIATWIGSGYATEIIDLKATVAVGLIFGLPALVLTLRPLRRLLLTPIIFRIFKKILPHMSNTERDALEAGTTWWDAELFSGKPGWKKLLNAPRPKLTEEEQSFLDNEGLIVMMCTIFWSESSFTGIGE